MAAIPQDIMTQANAIGAGMDQAMAQGAQIEAPTGKFSARALNALVAELNQLLPMMGRTEQYPEFTDDQTVIPTDLMQLMLAVQSIAEMAQAEFTLDLATMKADAQIAKLAALIKRLRDDKRLQDYLAQGMEPEVPEQAVQPEAPMAEPMGEQAVSDEELFASRMG